MPPTLEVPEIQFRKATLGNGLDVIVRRQPFLPQVAMNLWYHVGSKNEERGRRGFAHLFEHLMFEGSQHFPGDYFQPLQRLGAAINGSTSADRTNYFVDLPKAHFEVPLAMESDRMANLIPALSEHKLRVQKDVVKNEYRQNYANRPYGNVGRIMAEALYPPQHPYSWLTIGIMEDVEAATHEEVVAFFQRFYVPANSSLCLVGDLDEDEAFSLAEKYFGGIPAGSRALRPWTPTVELATTRKIVLSERVELDRLYRMWPTVPQFHAHDAALALLSDVLTRGRASRLYKKLVVEFGLAQDCSSSHSSRELAGSFGINVTLRPGQSLERVREVVDAELDDLANHGPRQDELEQCVNVRLAAFIYALDNIGGFGGVADRLNAYNVYTGDPGKITSDLARYQSVTPRDVREAARRYVHDCPEVCVEVRANKAKKSVVPLDRSVPPKSTPAAPFRAPIPKVRPLACGASLWVIPRRDLPIVAGSVVMVGGASVHTAAEAGLASLTSSLLNEGTKTRTSEQIALETQRLGTSLSASCGWDGSYVSFQALAPHLEASLDLASDILINPTFPEAEFDRIKGQTLAGIESDRDSAESRAYRALVRAIYQGSHAHPFGLSIDGTLETVGRMVREDLVRFHSQTHQAGRSAWVVAGDVDPDRLKELLDERLGGWPGNEHEPTRLPSPAPTTPRILLLDKPGAPQAVVRVGHLGVSRSTEDYEQLIILNQLLGGQFSSRLNAKLREEKGFTYGIRSQFDFRRSDGVFLVASSIQSDKVGEALMDIRGELVALLDTRPPEASEIDDARRALIEGQARQFENPAAISSRYASLVLYGFGTDHHAKYSERLEAVTIDAIREAAHRRIRPTELIAVVVADADSVRADLERTGWGPIELVTDI